VPDPPAVVRYAAVELDTHSPLGGGNGAKPLHSANDTGLDVVLPDAGSPASIEALMRTYEDRANLRDWRAFLGFAIAMVAGAVVMFVIVMMT
jgi:hypothetical protein